MKKTNKITEYAVHSFMSNVNKTDMVYHRRSHDAMFGTVTLKKSAAESKNGKRLFAVSGSTVIKNGSYSFSGLRKALLATVG